MRFLYFRYFKNNEDFCVEMRKPKYQFLHENGTGTAGKYVDHLRDIRKIRFKNIHGSILHSPAATFSILLSYVAFLVTLFICFLPAQRPEGKAAALHIFLHVVCNLYFWIAFVVVSFVLLLPIPMYLRTYVLNLPLEEYGVIYRNHLTESEMVSLTSYKIFEVCNYFDTVTRFLTPEYLVSEDESNECYDNKGEFLFGDMVTGKLADKVDRLNKIRDKVLGLQYELQQMERDLERVSVLIANLAKRLHVSEVQLCDHIFQFSPTLYNERKKKFYTNLLAAMDFLKAIHYKESEMRPPVDIQAPMFDRVRSLLYECQRFQKRNKRIAIYQCQNIAFADLHSGVLEFTTQKSSCEATKTYIKAFRDLFEGIDNRYTIACFHEKMKYLYFKRKAHMGVDLHHSAETLLQDMLRVDLLQTHRPGDNRKLMDFFCGDYLKGAFQLKDDQQLETFGALARDVRQNFLQTYLYSTPYIEKCRQRIRALFEQKYTPFFEGLQRRQQYYIITFGYSKIVRDAIKYTIPRMIRFYIEPEDISTLVKTVVFLPEHENKVDSRFIKHELTEENKREYLPVLVHHPNFILPLLDRNARILILMGAEAFDLKDRIVRTNEYKRVMADFVAEALPLVGDDPHAIRRVVLAESFKRNKDLSLIQRYLDDQFDKVEIYDSDMITEVVHDDIAQDV